MKVTALIENTHAPGMERLKAEHGLSLFIEHANKHILFDTGASGAFADNAIQLGVDIQSIDFVVISHHHYDHGGGLRRFLQLNEKATIYLRGPAFGECYGKFLWFEKYIGLDRELLREHHDRFVFINEKTTVIPGVCILTTVGSTYATPRGNRSIFVKTDGNLELDSFSHELVLVIQEPDGLGVFTGCAHQGVLNMVQAVTEAFPGSPIKAVFGGFHLMAMPPFNFMSGSKEEVAQIGKRLLEFPLSRVYTCHCTGSHAFPVLKGAMGEKLEYIGTGRNVSV